MARNTILGQAWKALTAASLLGVWSCKEMPHADPEPAASHANLSYGTDPAQVMDLSLPEGRSTTTGVIVFIHGGGWSGGDKSIFTATDIQKFTDRGYATANINYRLASSASNIHDPQLSNDVTAALDFLAAHAAEYKIASNRFGLVGHSAGAHLALLAGYKYDPQHRIKAVASLAGPTDLNGADLLGVPTIRQTIENYLGATQAADPARWTAASPISVATASATPTILMQGTLDVLVPYTQAQHLDERLTQLGVVHEYHLFPSYNHDLGYAAVGHFPDAVWDPVLAWFSAKVR